VVNLIMLKVYQAAGVGGTPEQLRARKSGGRRLRSGARSEAVRRVAACRAFSPSWRRSAATAAVA